MPTINIDNYSELEAIIAKSSVCYVGMVDTDQTPYVIPMNFGYKDGVIYMHSGNGGQKQKILERNPKVCIIFNSGHSLSYQHKEVACSYFMKSSSVMVYGEVSFEEDFDKKVEVLNIIMKQYSDREFKYSDPAVNNVKVWKIKIEKISGKVFGAPRK